MQSSNMLLREDANETNPTTHPFQGAAKVAGFMFLETYVKTLLCSIVNLILAIYLFQVVLN